MFEPLHDLFEPVAPPGPRARPVTDRARVLDMRASFGNFREGDGKPVYEHGRLVKGKGVVYTPSIPALWAHDRPRMLRWLDVLAKAGSTHIVIGDFEPGDGYEGSEFQFPDFTTGAGLIQLRQMFDDLMHLPAADGDGWRVMVQMDGGSKGYLERMQKWPGIVAALEPFRQSILWSVGWELVKASSWTSKDFGDGAARLRSLIGPDAIMIAHMSPGRNAFSSNPLEDDDPWKGSESACWKDPRFQFDAIFFQCDPPDPSDNIADCRVTIKGKQMHCSQHADVYRDGEVIGTTCWMDRIWDSLFRTGAGHMGVPKLEKWILGETIIYKVWHQGVDGDAFGTLIADVVERELVSKLPGLQIGFGNGLPSRLRR